MDRPTIGVMEFKGGAGITRQMADVLADILAAKISRMGDVDVITRSDIMSFLAVHMRESQLDCEDEDCIIEEIGGALGMSWMVTGSLSKFGEDYVLNLKLIDMRTAKVPSRVTRKVGGDERELFEEMLEATHELFERVADRLPLVPSVTIASKHRQSIAWSPSAITVLTREDIRGSGVASVTDLLRRVPGFDIYELKFSNPLVGARALTEDANNLVLLLVDGREAMVEMIGFAFWPGLTINLAEIERIEVIRGPGSTLYGANAFAAVVNIKTVSDRNENGSDVSVTAGQEGHADTFARVRGRYELGRGLLSFSAGAGSMDRLSPEDHRDNYVACWRSHGYLRYRQKNELDISLHAGLVQGELLNYFHMGDMRLTDATNYWLMGKSEVGLAEKIRLKAQVYHSRYTAVYAYRTSLRAYDIWLGDIPRFEVSSPTIDGQVQFDYQALSNLLLIAGGNLRHTGMTGTGLLPGQLSESRGAGFVHAQWHPRENVQITGGLRLDLNSETETAVSPRAVMVFRPWPDHAWRLGYARAFRKPSFFERNFHVDIADYNPALPELVEKMASELGSENLINEKVHSIETGWRSRLLDGLVNLSVDLFCNIYQDTIYFHISIPTRIGLPDIANSEFHYRNQKANIYALGGEFELKARPWADLVVWGNLGLRMVTDTNYQDLMRTEPVFRFNLGGGYRPDAGFQLDLSLHYVSAYQMPVMDPENLFDNPVFMPLGKTALVIGRAGYRIAESKDRMLECGLVFRTPLGNPFREYAGMPFPESLPSSSKSDFGGSPLHPWVSLYLRGSY